MFERYGPLPEEKFTKPPTRVHRRRKQTIYEGPRLLIKRGIDQNREAGGRIAARFETASFCFRDSIHCAPLSDMGKEKAKVLLAILWSSLTRYFLFLTSGTWGLWHDEVKKDVLYSLPVRFPKKAALSGKIVNVVDALRAIPEEAEEGTLPFAHNGLAKDDRDKKIQELEDKLDEAVYELFELTEEERERIEDLCGLGLDLFYRGMKSSAVLPLDWPDDLSHVGRRSDLTDHLAGATELCRYLQTFLELWEPQLRDQGGQLRWRIVRPPEASSMMAAIFETETAEEKLPSPTNTDEQEWADLLKRLGESSSQPARAKRVYIDGLIRIVTDSEMVIIKRNERRLWTKSAARDDAEAAMVMAMQFGAEGSRKAGAHG